MLLNRRHHAAEKYAAKNWIVPWSSAAWFDGWTRRLIVDTWWKKELVSLEAPTRRPTTCLLSTGWKRLGVIDFGSSDGTASLFSRTDVPVLGRRCPTAITGSLRFLTRRRLFVTMAHRYDRGGMRLADRIQEGKLGLMHTASRFDYRRGMRFSTYASWWIHRAIGRALAYKARVVRIPVQMCCLIAAPRISRLDDVRDRSSPPSLVLVSGPIDPSRRNG